MGGNDGGQGGSQGGDGYEAAPRRASAPAPAQSYAPAAPRAAAPAPATARPSSGFDDMDDDIPF